MGIVENLVKVDNQGKLLGPKPSLTQSNAAFAHPTIASYLSFMRLVDEQQLCRPVTMIIVTDGQPDPWDKQGGAKLYERLRSIRQILGVRTYVVAFTKEIYGDPLKFERIHEIACAASGAESIPTPCAGDNLYGWDTCFDQDNPAGGCAWLAEDHEQLGEALTSIISRDFAADVPGGPPTLASDFQQADPDDPNSPTVAAQTSLRAWTEVPSWRGHVVRGACEDTDPDNPEELADYCKQAETLPMPGDELESFGPCPRSRSWDAGACLQQTDPADRRLLTHGADGSLIAVAEDGQPTAAFTALVKALDAKGRIDPPLTFGNEDNEIAAMVDLLLGVDAPEGWKLPSISNAAPLLIRRIPPYDSAFSPSVGIRDPHCAGRRNAAGDDVPSSLKSFAAQAWETVAGGGLANHYDYAEAVLVGDDSGLLHAFHYDSGNELFA
ncbi:MAG: type IV pilin biogenesis protein, partial [Myxococcales bacterium]|nr:type IV pilin biogenesis protein [Myxococcales bacterium]